MEDKNNIEDWTNKVHQGGVREKLQEMPESSVDLVVTSPPYYGLRDYGDENQSIWDADEDCNHDFRDTKSEYSNGGNNSEKHKIKGSENFQNVEQKEQQYCSKCGAWKGQLGLEPSPQMYVKHISDISDEVYRVLKPSGSFYLNLGDTYAGGGGVSGQPDDWENKHNDEAYPDSVPARDVGFPNKCKMLIPHRVAISLIDNGWICRNDIVWHKCLSGGTGVYARTQKGVRKTTIKDIARLEPSTVELWDGKKWNQCVSFEKNKRSGDELTLELANGETIGCTQEHKWPTKSGLKEASDIEVGDVINSTTLPEPKNATEPEHIPNEIGWLIGLYIAEGSKDSRNRIQLALSSEENDIANRVERICENYDCTSQRNINGGCLQLTIYGDTIRSIIDKYVGGKTSKSKHLSQNAWNRQDEFIDQVLEGYLIGDGHYDENNNRWRFGFTENDELASDLRTIGARLGMSVRLRRVKHTLDGEEYPGWQGSIKSDECLRKREDATVVDISKSRGRVFWDISLEEKPHLFALNCGVLSHNSNPMPESVTDRRSTTFEYIFHFVKQQDYYYDLDSIREPYAEVSKKRSEYSFDGTNDYEPGNAEGFSEETVASHAEGKNPGDVQKVTTANHSEAHFAVFPQELIEPHIKSSCPEDGVVLDPFIGSGTTAVVAEELGRDWVGIDLNKDYVGMSYDRIENETKKIFDARSVFDY